MIFKLVFSSLACWKLDWVIYSYFEFEFQTKLHLLQDEIQRLKDIQRRLEKARDRGDKELPPWLVEHEQFQQLLTKVIQFLKLANCFMFPHVSSWKIGSHCLYLLQFKLLISLKYSFFWNWLFKNSAAILKCSHSHTILTPPHRNGHLANPIELNHLWHHFWTPLWGSFMNDGMKIWTFTDPMPLCHTQKAKPCVLMSKKDQHFLCVFSHH